jgi:hypothetical protein
VEHGSREQLATRAGFQLVVPEGLFVGNDVCLIDSLRRTIIHMFTHCGTTWIDHLLSVRVPESDSFSGLCETSGGAASNAGDARCCR